MNKIFESMKWIWPRLATIISAFTLGLYASSQFKFDQPIEAHRWIITSICLVFFFVLSNKKK